MVRKVIASGITRFGSCLRVRGPARDPITAQPIKAAMATRETAWRSSAGCTTRSARGCKRDGDQDDSQPTGHGGLIRKGGRVRTAAAAPGAYTRPPDGESSDRTGSRARSCEVGAGRRGQQQRIDAGHAGGAVSADRRLGMADRASRNARRGWPARQQQAERERRQGFEQGGRRAPTAYHPSPASASRSPNQPAPAPRACVGDRDGSRPPRSYRASTRAMAQAW